MNELTGRDLHTYGFLGYPLLQAADILIYKANAVPVGEDQVPHIELTREIARRFNHMYAPVFPEPQALLTKVPKLPGTDGRKMSKSYGNAIALTEKPEIVKQTLKTMVTDPARVRRQDPGNPDVCPVGDYHKVFSDEKRIAQVDQGCRSAGIGCIECKMWLFESLQKTTGSNLRAPSGTGRPEEGCRGHSRRRRKEGAGCSRRHDDRGSGGNEDLTDELKISLPLYEGPLDLLLDMIRKQKIDVYDIPIARITEQYLQYLRVIQELNIDGAGEFVFMAAQLIYIKSRMLLPPDPDGGRKRSRRSARRACTSVVGVRKIQERSTDAVSAGNGREGLLEQPG